MDTEYEKTGTLKYTLQRPDVLGLNTINIFYNTQHRINLGWK
jgi:hypothetical protein